MQLWKDNIRKITPYTPGIQPQDRDIIKLNTNENPYPPSPAVRKALDNLCIDDLRKYPSFVCPELKQAIIMASKKAYGLDFDLSENEIFLGNGSDEVLAICFQSFFCSDRPVLFPNITYSFYDVWCDLYKIKYERPKLNEDFTINKEDYFGNNGGVVLANPNAPTSIAMNIDEIEEIIANNPQSVVVIDEAYVDFGAESALGLIRKYDNLVVVQTMSKSRSLAGIRLGCAFANKELVDAMEAVKNSFNSYTVNAITNLAATESFKDFDYFKSCCERIVETRNWTVCELEKLGFKVLNSSANFVFASHPDFEGEKIYNYLLDRKIYVRFFNKPIINQYLRITIGTDEEMKAVIDNLKLLING